MESSLCPTRPKTSVTPSHLWHKTCIEIEQKTSAAATRERVLSTRGKNQMKIAVLGPVCWRTPPRHYGPWEQVVSNIAEGMVARGVEVTLFASGDSQTAGKLESVCPGALYEHPE